MSPGVAPWHLSAWSWSPGGRLVLARSWLMADVSRWSPWCLFCPWLMADALQVAPWHLSAWSCVELRPLVACPGLWLMLPGGRPGARFVPGRGLMLPGVPLVACVSRCAPGSFCPWSLARCFQVLRPGARFVPGLCSMLPGVAPWCSFRPWLMLDALQVVALVLVSSLAYG